jgi:hypothetical protein
MDDLSEASEDLLWCIMLLQKRVVHSRSVIKEFYEWLRSSSPKELTPTLTSRREFYFKATY